MGAEREIDSSDPSDWEWMGANLFDRMPAPAMGWLEQFEIRMNRPFLPDPTKRRGVERCLDYVRLLKMEWARRIE
ncbi:hypothetical protein HZA43_04410 [Candidatus Peregrinibacteria bacterium]|nr:hypothetical protein [Candidatus Peregrinibacteria bacterium]